MKFGETLAKNIHEPWRDSYLQYHALKKQLREDEPASAWSEDDESRFVEALDAQLERVYHFQRNMFQQLKEEITECETKIDELDPPEARAAAADTGELQNRQNEEKKQGDVLDGIMEQVRQLEKFSRLNYSGFLKIAKKHDRHHPRYTVRPLLQVRMSALPFNSEDYGPLLYRLSSLYTRIRHGSGGDEHGKPRAPSVSSSANEAGEQVYQAYKFWVHPDNVMEVKTYVLRRLPVLVYNPRTSKSVEAPNPAITSLYFDSPDFALYNKKLSKSGRPASLRLRWYGNLADARQIYMERKTVEEDEAVEQRLAIKAKYIAPFLAGEYAMEKTVAKMRDRHQPEGDIARYQTLVRELQAFIKEDSLQPVLRATYTRTAFQIPGDDSVRIALDTDLALIREDAHDPDRPCRSPDDWHRADIDDARMPFPFPALGKGQISRFPYTILEVKMQKNRPQPAWVRELMASHLVKEAPRFSKFLHGVATLFDNEVNLFPFWISEMDTDIRKDPQDEHAGRGRGDDEMVIGSLAQQPRVESTESQKKAARRRSISIADIPAARPVEMRVEDREAEEEEDEDEGEGDVDDDEGAGWWDSLRSRFVGQSPPPAMLPPGVRVSRNTLTTPVKVETKVWLANQRTFIKWQHISLLLASVALALYNSAGQHNTVAKALGGIYTLIALLAAAWGWAIYQHRVTRISKRSGKHFDNVIGPILITLALVAALLANFILKLQELNQ